MNNQFFSSLFQKNLELKIFRKMIKKKLKNVYEFFFTPLNVNAVFYKDYSNVSSLLFDCLIFQKITLKIHANYD